MGIIPKKDITVIGYKGVVGGATYSLLKGLGHNVTGVDINDEPVTNEIVFVCLPEKKVTPETLAPYHPDVFIVRSSTPPGTCRLIQEKLGTHVMHIPEFLKEATPVIDEFNPARIIIGECCHKHGLLATEIFAPLRRPIHHTNTVTSELVKIACNGFFATVISYWNTIDWLAEACGINGEHVGLLASTDPRIPDYGSRYHHKYGGTCLPKDIRQLIDLAKAKNIRPGIILETEITNTLSDRGIPNAVPALETE